MQPLKSLIATAVPIVAKCARVDHQQARKWIAHPFPLTRHAFLGVAVLLLVKQATFPMESDLLGRRSTELLDSADPNNRVEAAQQLAEIRRTAPATRD